MNYLIEYIFWSMGRKQIASVIVADCKDADEAKSVLSQHLRRDFTVTRITSGIPPHANWMRWIRPTSTPVHSSKFDMPDDSFVWDDPAVQAEWKEITKKEQEE